MGLFGLFDFPWGGTYVNNNGIDVALTFRQRIQIPRRGRRFFGLFTIGRRKATVQYIIMEFSAVHHGIVFGRTSRTFRLLQYA